MTTTRDLDGSRIVITGASSGIGLEAARRLAREGARLVLVARGREGLEVAARAAEDAGGTAHVVVADVTDPAQVQSAIDEAVAELGGIDVLVSSVAGLAYGAFGDLSAEDFARSHDVTFHGVVHPVRAALPHLERSGGTLVAVVSMAGKVPIPLHSPYVAAKHGVRGFLGSLRVELKHRGSSVRVCMVHPGFVGTPFFDHATSAVGTQPHPLRPVYRTEDVARAVVACVKYPRAELDVGGSALLLDVLTTVARPLSDLFLATYGVVGQRRDLPAVRPGMLWQASGRGNARGTV
ncbi:MAG TPA: SDR family oxidoreductase, partial [Solirubrobacteraceae bacterium]|nr:SDR family oxidoreductase [Solirubrobacteraceae bacterium]